MALFMLASAFEVAGWAIAGIALAVLVWALFWDRARGRRRCPKCWYDMAGSVRREDGSYTCPECGKNTAQDRGLSRVRRRWRVAGWAGVLFVGAWCVGREEAVRQRGLWAMAPRVVLIWMLPDADDPARRGAAATGGGSGATSEFSVRVFGPDGELRWLTPPERWLLVSRARIALARESTMSWAKSLSARALVRLRGDAVESTTGAGRGHVLIARMSMEYARLKMFRCRGVVFGNIGVRDEKPFIIAMERPDRFRFEFMSGHPSEKRFSMRFVVWQDGGPAREWWTLQPQMKESPDVRMPLAAGTGISGASAIIVPSLLLPSVLGGSRFEYLTDVVALTDGDHEGRSCFRVRGTLRGTPETLWIEKSTFMLLRHDDFQGDTTSYKPEGNRGIDRSWFTFDPEKQKESPLQDEGWQVRPPAVRDEEPLPTGLSPDSPPR